MNFSHETALAAPSNNALAAPRTAPWIEPLPPEGSGVRAFANRLLEHAWLAAGVFFAVVLAGVLFALFATPVYRVDGLLQIEERAAPTPVGVANRQTVFDAPVQPLTGEMEILRSRELLLRAIEATQADIQIDVENRFPLIGDWAARRHAGSGAAGVASAPWGLSAFAWGGERLVIGKLEIPPVLYGEDLFIERHGANEWLLFDASRKYVARGSFNQDVPVKFGDFTGSVRIDELVGNPGTRFRVVRNDMSLVYADLAKQLRVAEPARQSGVVRLSLDAENPKQATALLRELMRGYLDRTVRVRTGDAQRSLTFLEEQLPQVKTNLEKAEEALSSYRSRTHTVNLDHESQAAFQQVVQLEKSRIDLELKQRELAERFGNAHPTMQTVNQQLGTVRRQLESLNSGFGRLPQNQRDVVRLEREVATNAALYTSMLNSVQELKVARAGMVGNARIVDAPRASAKPVHPRPMIILSIAGGLALIGSFLTALFAGLLRPTIRDSDEIDASVGLPTVITVPESAIQRRVMRWVLPFNASKSRLLSLMAPEEPAVESLRSFRMHLTHPSPTPIKHLLITSATAGVGKTFISANLASLLGSARKRVLLVEADMRHPHLQTYFGTPCSPGLADVLAGTERFEQVVHREVLPNVDLLMPGEPYDNPADLLSSPRLRTLLEQLDGQYEHVIFDSVPILPAGDSLAIAQLPVSTFLVARAEHSTLREVQEAARRLEGINANIRGVVFNGAKRLRISNLRYYTYRTSRA